MNPCDISESNYRKRYGQYLDFESIISEEYKIIGKRLADSISRTFSGKVQVLDVGCGTGAMSKTLIELLNGSDIHLVFDYLDPVDAALNIYEQNIPAQYRRHRLLGEWASFETDEKYDLLLANNSLCGLDVEAKKNVEKFRSILKEEGIALVTLPSNMSDWAIHAKKYWPSIHGTKEGKTRFEDLTKKLGKYKIPHTDTIVPAPVQLFQSNLDKSLRAVFSVMMYVDVGDIDSKYHKEYISFKNSVAPDNKLNFMYGITEIRK